MQMRADGTFNIIISMGNYFFHIIWKKYNMEIFPYYNEEPAELIIQVAPLRAQAPCHCEGLLYAV